MKIVFFGTSDFALCALKALFSNRHKILGVVTAEDKARGRGQRIGVSPVKLFAQGNGLALFQPANLREAKFIRSLKNTQADLFVVCAYGKILTKGILQIPQNYAINLHASLLPKYRGAAPLNWAIIKGERQSGITIFKMNEYMDKGEIILQKKTDISASDSAVSLAEKLSSLGAEALLEAVDLIAQGNVSFRAQDETHASFAPKLKKEDGLIDWRSSASEICNRIRGLEPWPGAFTYLKNSLLKIWEGRVAESEEGKAPGEIIEVNAQKGILVQTGKDSLLITAVQLEGKRRMPAGKFILGHRIEVGEKLGQ